MDFLSDKHTFKVIFVSCTILSALVAMLAIHIARKNGINIYKKNRILKLSFCSFPILFFPIIAHPDIDLLEKLQFVFIGIFAAVAIFYTVDKGGKKFRRLIGYETKWDKEEKYFEEVEKKTNNAK